MMPKPLYVCPKCGSRLEWTRVLEYVREVDPVTGKMGKAHYIWSDGHLMCANHQCGSGELFWSELRKAARAEGEVTCE